MDIAKVFGCTVEELFFLRIDAGLPPCRELPCGAAAFFFGKGYFAAGAAKRPKKFLRLPE